MREIVIELERVQKIRRRAAVVSAFCFSCLENRAFVSLRDAARLFEIAQDELAATFRTNNMHLQHLPGGEDGVCVISLFDFIERRGHRQDRLSGPEITETNVSEISTFP
ncbi:MAG: hypothetical protein KIT61_05870 [Pyrinomonadaceae bacterium]|nr:hypothetical protein [Blastocatellia bacterium]MCW5956093.1 hypothetical protein [Pyrinomonadaceae bacterium]